MSKTYRIQIGGRRGQVVKVYDCGTEGERFEKALAIARDKSDEACSDFIEEEFDYCNDAFWAIQPLLDGMVNVRVEDEDGDVVFMDEEVDPYERSLSGCPQEWQLSGEMGDTLRQKLQDAIDKFTAKGLDISEDDYNNWDDNDDLSEFRDDIVSEIIAAPLSLVQDQNCNLLLVEAPDVYGFFYECVIELADDEEFDIDKLHLMVSDYDGYPECYEDSILPVILYGNTFYELEIDDWEEHYPNYLFAQLAGYSGTHYIETNIDYSLEEESGEEDAEVIVSIESIDEGGSSNIESVQVETMFCVNCGEKIGVGTSFCTRCGSPVVNVEKDIIAMRSDLDQQMVNLNSQLNDMLNSL